MAQSVLQKLRTIILGNMHALLDKVIDLNSPAAIRQYIRDLEAAIEDLQGEAAIAQGNMKTQEDKLTGLEAQIKELDVNIDFILGDGDDSNDHLAEPLQARLIRLEQQKVPLFKEVEGYRQTMEALDQTASSLKAKHEAMMSQLNIIEQQSRCTMAKNNAASAIEAAVRFTEGPSVDNVVERVTQQANIADARFQRAIGDAQTGLGQDAMIVEARTRLAARKAVLKEKNRPS